MGSLTQMSSRQTLLASLKRCLYSIEHDVPTRALPLDLWPMHPGMFGPETHRHTDA